jgi:DNA-binding GntR family transcriptional regulator
MATSPEIAQRIVEAILAQKLAPGERLGEQPLADLFGVSRTLVREALTRLAARGIVTVTARRGWYVIEPSVAEAREAFEAREVIETGLLRRLKSVPPEALKRLKGHVFRERQAIRKGDVGTRSYLLGDFHVCLAECAGNALLADALRDLTARTTLISMLYQSTHQAEQSCREHEAIVAALGKADLRSAGKLMHEHLRAVAAGLDLGAVADPMKKLREALEPVAAGRKSLGEKLPRRGRRAPVPPSPAIQETRP